MSTNRVKTIVRMMLVLVPIGALAVHASLPVEVPEPVDGRHQSVLITPDVHLPESATTAPLVPSDLDLAAKAAADRQWELVIHYATRAMQEPGQIANACEHLSKAGLEIADAAVAGCDLTRGAPFASGLIALVRISTR